jgi:hypothetical protein
MNRRRFFAWLFGTAAGVALGHTLDLDKLLWVPGEKTIFLPPEPKIIRETLRPGDYFTIEGAYAINPVTRKRTPHLQWFVATQEAGPDDVLISAIPSSAPIFANGKFNRDRNKVRRWA